MSISNNNQQINKELSEAYYKANWQRNKILVLAIAMSVFLLYSVFSISYGKIYSDYLVDVRGMGTKATVSLENGSKKQYQAMQELSYLTDVGIKKVMGAGTYQNLWNGTIVFLDETAYEKLMKPAYTDIKGIFIGSIIGIILVKLFLSEVLQKLFMHGLGESDVRSFYPLYLFFACFFVFLISFSAAGLAVQRVMKWNAIDSIKYTDVSISYRKKKIKSEEEISLLRFAWRNITRLKRRFFISVLSLFIGCITMLGAAVITKGVDITNEIEEYPDFQLGTLTGIFRFPDKVPEKINDDTPVLPSDMVKTVLNLKGIQKNTVEQTIGSYAMINFAEDIALQPRKESLEGVTKEEIVFATLQIVTMDYLEELSQYTKKQELPIDIESVINGTGCILLHYHELSQTLEEKAADMLGKPIHFYSLNANGNTSIESYQKGELNCAGYMDITNKYFPKLQTTSMGNNINYFIMTKEALEQLGFSEKCFDLSFDVLDYEEAIIHQKLVQIIQRENINSEMMDTFYLKANSDLLETEQSQIKMTNLILEVLCFIIMMIGIMNYANTLMAGFATRVKEFAIMESIGLTRKQLWKLLFMEGLYYWIIVMGSLTTIGTGILWFLGKAIKKKLLYFKFIYPLQVVLGLAVILLLICFAIPGIMYFKSQKQSLTDKLRCYVD